MGTHEASALPDRYGCRHIAAILIIACLAGSATEATAAEPQGRAYLFRGMIDLID